MPYQENNIELRSEEVQEIIGTPPRKLVRYGILVIFLIVVTLFTGSFFFKYPDVIQARLTLTGENPPADIKARTSGKITKLFISDKQIVEKGTLLAIIENTCDYDDIKILQQNLEFLHSDSSYLAFYPKSKLKLGELQSGYSAFLRLISEYRDFINLNYHTKKIDALNKQLSAYQQSLQNQHRQVKLLKHDFALGKKQFLRDSSLFEENVLPEAQFETSKSAFLHKEMAIESANNSLTNLNIQISELEQQILDMQLQYQEQKRKFTNTLTEQSDNLESQIALWEQSYLLKSPIRGKVSFTTIWSATQNAAAGETVFTIVPQGRSRLIGRIQIPLAGAGKVETGQSVNVKFDNFPETEFGMVRAKIEAVSLIQKDEYYTVRVSFPDSLTTSYKKQLPFIQNMQANADIITEDMPLIVRFINPLKSLFYN